MVLRRLVVVLLPLRMGAVKYQLVAVRFEIQPETPSLLRVWPLRHIGWREDGVNGDPHTVFEHTGNEHLK